MIKPKQQVHQVVCILTAIFAGISVSAFGQQTPGQTLGQLDSGRSAQTLIDQIDVLEKNGEYAAAIPLAENLVAIRESTSGREHTDTATALTTLGRILRLAGELPKSEAPLKRAVAIREKVLGADHLETADALANLGSYYYFSANFQQAIEIYKRALAIKEKKLGPDHVDTVALLGAVGTAYIAVGEYEQAETLLLRTLEINERQLGPDHPMTAKVLINIASVRQETGNYKSAEELLLRAIAIREKTAGPEHPLTVRALNQLAVVYLDAGAFAKAEPIQVRVVQIQEKVLGAKHPDFADSLNDLARVYLQLGDPKRAEPFAMRALAIQEEVLGVNHPDTADTVRNLADIYLQAGEYAKAEPLYRRSLAEFEKSLGPRNRQVAISLDTIGKLKWAAGQPDAALAEFRRAQAIHDQNIDRYLESGDPTQKQSFLRALGRDPNTYVTFSIAAPSQDSAALGLLSVLHYKGRVLDAMSESMARLRARLNSADQSSFDELIQIANRLSTLTYQKPGDLLSDLTDDEYQQQLKQLADQQERLEAQLAKRSSEFRNQTKPITIKAVSQSIPHNAALVEWFRYLPIDPTKPDPGDSKHSLGSGERYMAYVMKRDGMPIAIDCGVAEEIDKSIYALKRALSDPSRADVKRVAAVLSNQLLKPIYPNLQTTKHLLLSPDSALNLIPMAALLDEQRQYLAERYELTYLTSGRDLLRMQFNQRSKYADVIVADPNFDSRSTVVAAAINSNVNSHVNSQRSTDLDRGGLVFWPLTNTASEAHDLQKLLKLDEKNIFLGIAATEANVKQLHGPRILHIATHGFFLSDQHSTDEQKNIGNKAQSVAAPENPLLRSGIALSGANARHSGASDDGILTALEVAQLDLHGTELVVLSACDSGVGDVQNGEGVYGLRRALVLAGAQTQVTSLWKVSDEATRMLMVDFYRHLLNGEGRSAALLHAQQAMLSGSDFAHPYYWASFVSVGNWAPLPTAH